MSCILCQVFACYHFIIEMLSTTSVNSFFLGLNFSLLNLIIQFQSRTWLSRLTCRQIYTTIDKDISHPYSPQYSITTKVPSSDADPSIDIVMPELTTYLVCYDSEGDSDFQPRRLKRKQTKQKSISSHSSRKSNISVTRVTKASSPPVTYRVKHSSSSGSGGSGTELTHMDRAHSPNKL